MEKSEFLKSMFSNISGDYVEKVFIDNGCDVDATISQLSSCDKNSESKLELDFDELNIRDDIVVNKTTTWLNLFPQLAYNEIYNAIYNCQDVEDDDLILAELNFLAYSKQEQEMQSSDTLHKDQICADRLTNELILFEYDLSSIMSNNLLSDALTGTAYRTEIIDLKKKQFLSMCDVPDHLVSYSLEVNGFHVGNAITNCILKYHSYIKDLEYTFRPSKSVKNSIGVVQRRTISNKIDIKNLLKEDLSSFNQEDHLTKSSLMGKPPFSANNLHMSKQFFDDALAVCKPIQLSEKFLYQALGFFNADFEKVLNLLSCFARLNFLNECSELVDEYYTETDTNPIKLQPYLQKTSTTSKKHRYTVKKYTLIKKPLPHNDTPNINTSGQQQLSFAALDSQENKRIDLHGYTGDAAISIISSALKTWWLKELSNREAHATKEHHIRSQKAQFISPLEIITGKGLHSHSGKSVIRKRCKEYLISQNYSFVENAGSFIVTGKKKRS